MSTSIINQVAEKSGNRELILRAFEFAEKAHYGQKRISGEDYIIHPLAVAQILSKIGLDAWTIAAGVLHDVADDTKRSFEDIEKEFGKEVVFMVSGVSKLGQLRLPKAGLVIEPIKYTEDTLAGDNAENLRKMFFAMAKDIRIILIKLADRLHNMKTLGALPPQKQKRISLETLEIYAPIANRLGMGEIKGQLEDLAFPYLYPKEFEWLMGRIKNRYEEGEKYLNKAKPILTEMLQNEGLHPLDIHLRAKHSWSLYQKLLRHGMNIEKIHDIVALRVILNSVEDCYQTLGTIHQRWLPLPGLIKDYIAFPKPNNYRSLHTTCFCLDGKITEIQIKTREMHIEAENGIAAHWAYKEGLDLKNKKFAWVKQLMDWQKEISGSKEFLERLKIDFFKNRIFVLTPKGDVIDLPEGATPVDFAYSVHGEVGEKCSAAKINGKISTLNSELHNGDLVEIITERNKKPSRDWLEFVKTAAARTKIKEWFRKESRPENLTRGIALLNETFRSIRGISFANIDQHKKDKLLNIFHYRDLDSLAVAVGQGEVSPGEILKSVFGERDLLSRTPKIELARNEKIASGKAAIVLAGTTGIAIKIAKCCLPQPNEKIMAYISKSKPASVHKENCVNFLSAKEKWPQKIIEASWTKNAANAPYLTTLSILTEDRIGLLRDITSLISSMDINIVGCYTQPKSATDKAIVRLTLEIDGIKELEQVFERLKSVDGLLEIKKI